MTMVSPVTIAERTLRDADAAERGASQRNLVALSLLRCPDRAPRER
jgi:hypothetical protein